LSQRQVNIQQVNSAKNHNDIHQKNVHGNPLMPSSTQEHLKITAESREPVPDVVVLSLPPARQIAAAQAVSNHSSNKPAVNISIEQGRLAVTITVLFPQR
jgi:hypothetical protein